ncbi:MAG: FAD-binding protein, partial [Betaproteobacteria bacterium]|nr:FAD-binding protein [Betaproteobacteria bacterium]
MGAADDRIEPRIDPQRQAEVARALRGFLPERAVLWDPEDTRPYECDGLSMFRRLPMVVALPETEEQVQQVLKTCCALRLPVVARGAGTGLSGGALPASDGVLLSMAKFMRVVRIDPLARVALVQPGVRNLAISDVVAPFGL